MRRMAVFLLMLLIITGCDSGGAIDRDKGLKLEPNQYIVVNINEDITGDSAYDEIYLIGYQDENEKIDVIGENYYRDLSLVVINGTDKSINSIPLKYSAGLYPSIIIKDFDLDGVKDIFISLYTIPSGGANRGLFSIISFKGDEAKIIFDDESIIEEMQILLILRDDHIVEVFSHDFNITTSFKLEESLAEELKKEGIYKNGKIMSQVIFTIDRFTELNTKGEYELEGFQYVAIGGHTGGLGFLRTLFRYDINESRWKAIDIKFDSF